MRVAISADSDELKGLTVEYDHSAGDLDPTSNRLIPVRVRVPIDAAGQGTHKIHVTVTAAGDEAAGARGAEISQSTSFIVPRNL